MAWIENYILGNAILFLLAEKSGFRGDSYGVVQAEEENSAWMMQENLWNAVNKIIVLWREL